MSDQWEVLAKDETFTSGVARIFTGGVADPVYRWVVRNTETGDIKTVVAHDEFELGEMISDGDFEDADFEDD